MLRKYILLLVAVPIIAALSQKPSIADTVNYNYIIDAESRYIASCVVSSGAIIMGQNMLYTFQGTPHYKICPYFSNFAAIALLDNPIPSNLAIVKNWMIWVFNHLNPDGSIYDYYVDEMSGGTEHPSIDAYPGENIPDFDSQDSYAATFLTLARKYAEVVPADISWLRGYSYQLELVGNALYSVVDDGNHYFNQFGPDNNDGLTVAKLDYQVKYTMDNSEVNEGLRDMIWLQENVSTYNNPSFYQIVLNNNTNGFVHLWNYITLSYHPYEWSLPANWNTFYPDATCQLFPIWTGVISPSSSRATNLYSRFNSHYPDWQNGTYYDPYPWTIICYVAAVMDDSSRVNSYLSYVQNLLNAGQNPPNWYIMEAAFTLRAAKRMSLLTGLNKIGQQISQSSQFPQSLALENYPNPFNPSTVISYRLPKAGYVSLKIYDVLGNEIATLVDKYQQVGDYSIQFSANDYQLSSGIYFYRLQAGSFSQTKKLMLIK